MVDFIGSDCLPLHPGSLETPFRPKMTDCQHSCFQLIMVDFIVGNCPLLNPGSLETPFRPKMTDCQHSCLQSIEVDFIVGDCPPSPRAAETARIR